VVVNLNNLAMVLEARGEAGEAEVLLKRALTIKERLFGAENVEWAMTANNLGVLYREHGRRTEAEELLTRALAAFERTLTEGHPNLVACRDNLAALLRAKTGETNEA
jgi:tetratricopeptide (TPR) repeat protein